MPRSVNMMKEIWVPALKPFVFKEQQDPRTGQSSYIMKGLILPFDQVSRNNVLYNKGSIVEKHQDLLGRPVMYNHKIEGNELPMGHFIKSYIVDSPDAKHPASGWYYEADIDPHEKDIIRKLKRGDLRHISIQLVGGQVVERMDEDGPYSEAYVSDIIEGSLVPAPGFLDTSAEFAEAFKAGLRKEQTIEDEKDRLSKILFNRLYSELIPEEAQKIDDYFRNNEQFPRDKNRPMRYEGEDLMIRPWNGEEAETPEELAEGYIKQLGEQAVMALIEKYTK